MNINVKPITIQLLKKNRRKSLGSKGRQRILRLDTKSTKHKRKKMLNWNSSKLKLFAL